MNPLDWRPSVLSRFGIISCKHETLLGLLPLASLTAQRVLPQVRPWIEPAQSHEKNQRGLGQVFLNGLRFTWAMALLADAAVLLRARVSNSPYAGWVWERGVPPALPRAGVEAGHGSAHPPGGVRFCARAGLNFWPGRAGRSPDRAS